MNASFRDLKSRVQSVDVPQVDVAGLVASGERRLSRRRAAVTAGGVAAVLALAIGSATWADRSNRSQEPVKEPSPSPTVNAASVRQLAYAVGNTIHYGDRAIDVGQYVHFVDVTDDGVAFVRGGGPRPQPGVNALWFSDGSAIERIGTVSGSPSRGYDIASSDPGSILAWQEPIDGSFETQTVVFDTDAMQVLTRLPIRYPGNDVLSVHDDAVYWVSDDASCELPGDGRGFGDCLRFESVTRHDVATGSSEQVSGATYVEDRRSRPRTIVGPYQGDAAVPGAYPWDSVTFERHDNDLVPEDFNGEVELTVREGRTDEPIQLRVPAESTSSTYFELTQWLDDDRFVLFAYTGNATELADKGDIFTCGLSSDTCRLELRGEPGTAYQMPRLD